MKSAFIFLLLATPLLSQAQTLNCAASSLSGLDTLASVQIVLSPLKVTGFDTQGKELPLVTDQFIGSQKYASSECKETTADNEMSGDPDFNEFEFRFDCSSSIDATQGFIHFGYEQLSDSGWYSETHGANFNQLRISGCSISQK